MADAINTVTVTNPDDVEDTAAEIVIESNVVEMNLAELDTTDAYVFKFWAKKTDTPASATLRLKLNNTTIKTFDVTDEWQMFEYKFLASAEDKTFMQFTTGTYLMWHSKMEHGTKATAYTESPIDFQIVTSAAIDILSNQISLKVTMGDVVNALNVDTTGIYIDAANLNINGAVSANGTFSIDTNGNITCTGGKIGGWEIGATELYNSYTDSNTTYRLSLNSNTHKILSSETKSNNVRLTELSQGGVYCSNNYNSGVQNTEIALGRQTTFMQTNSIRSGIGISETTNTMDNKDSVMTADRFYFGYSAGGEPENEKACTLAWNWTGKQTRGLYLNSGAYDSTSQSYKEYTIHIGSNGVKLDSEDASRALYLTSGKYIRASNVTATELGYLSGLTKNIETGKQDTLTTEVVGITNVVSINSGASQVLSVNYPSGVTQAKMKGIVGVNPGGTHLAVVQMYWDSALHIRVVNVSSSAVTPSGASITIIHT